MRLLDLSKLFMQQGQELLGSELSPDSLIEMAHSINPHKRYCIVLDWFYVDLLVTDTELGVLSEMGFSPSILLSSNVVQDERGRFPTGGWVKSGYLVDFSQGCIFETSNTFYLLMGIGFRKQLSLDDLSNIS
ncbi:DUF6957 family protein [Pseudomonas syringae]|uniref:DUF6957 domain-containing protein n=1 Tax=Pseudomonas syringae TaxID=317 RepID=A0A085V9K9_PSESX|nr:hypothetical protein [Pseudomonas syringae]KFE52122.1 hypothetical protein IV02_10215 [Pseudomonas syringae]